MKLPDIEYGAPVQDVTAGPARVDAERRKALDVFSEGLQRYGQELVKTKTQRAGVELQEGLAKLEQDLNASPYVSARYVREQLGTAIDALPQDLKDQLTQKFDDGTEVDAEQLPAWAFAGAIYEKKAKDLIAAASRGIPGQGWQTSFQDAARGDVATRAARFNAEQLRGLHTYLATAQRDHVRRRALAGDFDGARRDLELASAIDPAEKIKHVDEIEKARQLWPLQQAVVAGVKNADDAARVRGLIRSVEDGRIIDQATGEVVLPLDRLEQADRIQWKGRLEAELKEFEQVGKEAAAHPFREADEAAWNRVLGAYREAKGRPLPMSLVPQPGQVSATAQKALIAFVEGTRTPAKEVQTDWYVYNVLNTLAKDKPDEFKKQDLTPFLEKLSNAHKAHFLDLQRTLQVKGVDDPKYQGFVGAQEETNRLLMTHGFKTEGKGKEDDALPVAFVHSAVNHELDRETRNKGRVLTLEERDKVISKVVAREVQKRTWRKAAVPAVDVDPAYAGPLRAAAKELGLKPDDLKGTWETYQVFEPDIERAWKETGQKKVLDPPTAVKVFTIWQKNEKEIDAALVRAKKEPTAQNRAALALAFYLRGGK